MAVPVTMPKHPDLHPHSDRRSFERLMLLVAAIAQNPGIGAKRNGDGVAAMQAMLAAMLDVAAEQGIAYEPCSLHTLKKALGVLRDYGLLPRTVASTEGYYLGLKQERPKLPPRIIQPRKSKLSVAEIGALREQGLSYQAIADRAGLSKARIGQILAEYDRGMEGKGKC